MANEKWAAPQTIATELSTGLNSIGSPATSGLSSGIDNEAGLYDWMAVEIYIAAQGSARSAGAYVRLHLVASVDGTNYGDLLTRHKAYASELDAATTARYIVIEDIPIKPFKYKLAVENQTGQAFASSGNTVKYRLYNKAVS